VKLLVAVFCVFVGIVVPRGLRAQIESPAMNATAEPRTVEVGEALSVSLSVTVDSNAPSPSEPHLALPEGLRAGPPNISTQTQISFVNGRLSRRSGITATWQVVATREGVFVATPSIAWNGRRLQANALRVTVHPATPGGRARRTQPAPNPFDPFGMFPKLPNLFDQPEAPPATPADPELYLDAPLDSKVFLRSVVDQNNPVVGEQVTLTIYAYARVNAIELADVHEPSTPDFFLRELMPQGSQPEPRAVVINGVVWRAQAILKKALFPLRAGELSIGPMQVTVVGGRASGLAGGLRESQEIKVHVSEPPMAGRPVGYQIGDVGRYTLSVTVDPRVAEVGGAVAVVASLAGVGNVPNAIRVPLTSSFEWLEPQVRESIEAENGKIRGSRSFSYIVRPKVAGNLEMGEITLVYWNPDKKAYETARAPLGKVDVAPQKKSTVAQDPVAPHDPWSSLGRPRDNLGGYPQAREPLTEKPFYWIGLFGAPGAVVVGTLGSRGVRRLRSRLSARRGSAERGIDQALAQAREARKRQDRAALAAALERAVYLAIERATTIKARALLIDDIPSALEHRKVPSDLALEIRELLSSIETTRFTPEAAPPAGELADRVVGAVRRMGRLPTPGRA
jgi:hypothetical protein